MTELKTLLFATDFSTGAARCCNMARTLARLSEARLHIVHIVTEGDGWPLQATEQRAVPESQQATSSEGEMKRFIGRYFPNLDQEPFTVTWDIIAARHTSSEIVHQAELIDAGMILMGTEGRSGVKRLLAGSTAEAVVRTASVPVVTIRNGDR